MTAPAISPFLALAALLALCLAVPAGSKPGRPAPLHHGIELTAAVVGPAAIGIGAPARSIPGTTLKDGAAYPFARAIPGTATYDGVTVPGPHLLIEGVTFAGPVDISTGRAVVMRGVSIRVTDAAPWAVHTRPGAGAFYFLYSEASAASNAGAPHDKRGVVGLGLQLRADNGLVRRSHIFWVGDGIHPNGAHTRIEETLIDALTTYDGDHNDGIQIESAGPDISVIGSRIENPNPQTSCLYLQGSGVTIADSYLAGGGWTIYGGARANGHTEPAARNVRITGTIFGRKFFPKGGHFGPVAYWDGSAASGNVWVNNRYEDGTEISP